MTGEDGQSTQDGLGAFCALACGITWALSAPLAWHFAHHAEPPPTVLLMAGLSAFGPTIAAAVVAWRTRAVRETFGRWTTSPRIAVVFWVGLALVLCLVLHQIANVLEVALGGQPARWLYPPERPEHFAALAFFSIGEELGWRGFAYPRFAARFGPVVGSLLLGLVWTVWHASLIISPVTGTVDVPQVIFLVTQLPLYSVIFAWFLERSSRSLAVAIALHASAHLDNVTHAAPGEVRLQALRFVVVAVAAGAAAWSLRSGSARSAASAQ